MLRRSFLKLLSCLPFAASVLPTVGEPAKFGPGRYVLVADELPSFVVLHRCVLRFLHDDVMVIGFSCERLPDLRYVLKIDLRKKQRSRLYDDVSPEDRAVLTDLLVRSELEPAKTVLQLHAQRVCPRTMKTEFVAQGEFADFPSFEQWFKDVASRHDLAYGWEWLVCDETADCFVKRPV